MEKKQKIHYMTFSPRDEEWGIVCTTAGYQTVAPNSDYPPAGLHPSNYLLSRQRGRTLREYQMVYITEGEGWFESAHCRRTRITAGTMFLIFPDEWHNYAPARATGWKEYWIGFRGKYIDGRVQNGFFSPERPLVSLGNDINIEQFYMEVLREAEFENTGFQMLISSVVIHILGLAVYKQNFHRYEGTAISDKIEKAKNLMRLKIGQNVSPEKIAAEIGIGYTWFRREFKEQVGISPAQYQQQLRHIEAKKLLLGTDLTIAEIAYDLGFSGPNMFSTFFHKMEGITPTAFRRQ